jgi:hypothetical protein
MATLGTEFNLSTYREILANGKQAGYRFMDFSEISRENPSHGGNSNLCLLRHDVDADICAALIMAQLEHDLGVAATYFLMLRSPVYNLMGRKNHMMVEEILALGHAIGLHYDQGFDAKRGWSASRTASAVGDEAKWLETQFNTDVAAVLQGNLDTGLRINTYDRRQLSGFDYFSDSNRQFPLVQLAKGNISNAVAALSPRNLQLLIHPVWWVYDDPSTEAVWDRAIYSNLERMQEQLIETERAYGDSRQFRIESR